MFSRNLLIWLLLSITVSAHADEAMFNVCMARAKAIRTTAEIRDKGVPRHDYEVGYAEQWGQPPGAAENEVLTIVYATPNYSPAQLYRIAVNGCQRFLR